MLDPLDRKLLRDLSRMKGQVVAVSLVMACGLAMMIMTRSLILTLESTREAYSPPLSPSLRSAQRLFQGPVAKSKFLAVHKTTQPKKYTKKRIKGLTGSLFRVFSSL